MYEVNVASTVEVSRKADCRTWFIKVAGKRRESETARTHLSNPDRIRSARRQEKEPRRTSKRPNWVAQDVLPVKLNTMFTAQWNHVKGKEAIRLRLESRHH